MAIEHAILALLATGSRSGYDLKKVFADSESLPWSGNNNQVYKALVGLHRGGLTDQEVQQPAEGPSRKVYTITATGLDALRSWLLTTSETPQLRAEILVRLAGADLLSNDELDLLLAHYGEELRLKLLGLEELQRRGTGLSFGSERQRLLWDRINERPLQVLRAEEEWVRELRWALAQLERKQSE